MLGMEDKWNRSKDLLNVNTQGNKTPYYGAWKYQIKILLQAFLEKQNVIKKKKR